MGITETGNGQHESGVGEVVAERRQLTNIAYRLLGSLADAEDAVQEAYARWYAMTPGERAAIASPGAWLTTVTSRVCLNVLGSARARRERYVGDWIPEPVPDGAEWGAGRGGAVDPAERVTLDESVGMAFLVVLDAMTPAERVAFVLHDVFRYPFGEVARIVGRTPAACRQLASSARRRIHAAAPPVPPRDEQAAVLREFKQAWEAKDIAGLVGLLDPEATAITDGGGLVQAVGEPVVGGAQIANACVRLAEQVELTLLERTVNGQPGLVSVQDGVTVAVLAFEIADGRIRRIWSVRNPEKLRAWAR
ncbi:RNA polymerase sigma factor SigJ [Streptomyces sp. TRM66268-LWL]|uniref:RNA polymerase sigma factor SigJ n=1 Tax=Streptomyces polyasparticus TaxID=2767826 RepID=A0ABR7SWC1_9ACTN|nr:RNA polymerase sigma factor SigJ [Streptomyces polyasparticus]MBC9718553.1 RNA polymerase sigma factor SigJ [Streptomyces polyasparticus]